jgi:O-methyltransferase
MDTYQDHLLDKKQPRNFFRGQHIISDQISRESLDVVWRELDKVLQAGVHGAVVEFGCYVGTTSQYVRRLLDQHNDTREFHVYDSFEGLPNKVAHDQSPTGVDFVAGSLKVSKREYLAQFQRAGLKPPVIHKGWFDRLADADIPAEIALAFLDGDLYNSILDSLRLIWTHMSNDGTILIDDYQHTALPGVDKAITDFFADKKVNIRGEHNIAIIKKIL